jgi:hypothetical protein
MVKIYLMSHYMKFLKSNEKNIEKQHASCSTRNILRANNK